MANPLSVISNTSELAYLSGLFNWQMEDASYVNPNGNKCSFHIISNNVIPLEQYAQGAINTYDLISGASNTDPNNGLFNTSLIANGLDEDIVRKYTVNRIPYANYDQLVDLGTGSQQIVFQVVFAGTMYLTALINLVQTLFINDVAGLGILNHPLYQEIKNVLPIKLKIKYNYEKLNCVVYDLVFLTSDISHLSPSIAKLSTLSNISKWYVGIQNAITSFGGTISALKAIGANTINSL